VDSTIPVEDGELQLGVLLPLSGAGTEIGSSMRDAIELAVSEINDPSVGGVNGRPISLYIEDEGDDATTALGSLDKLMGEGVDAIIGPASSLIAPQILPITVAKQVLTCSPTASALSLDAYPDNGLFLRTIPSDSLQAVAIARAIEQTGKPTAAISFIDDSYGRPFAELVADELGRRGISVLSTTGFDPADPIYTDEATTVLDTGAKVVAVIGDASAGPRMVEALFDKSNELPAQDQGVEIIVNDAMRVPTTASTYARLADDDRALLSGVSPQSRITNEALLEKYTSAYPDSRGLFASYAYDCVNLIALAANSSGSTRASTMAEAVVSVADGGTPCATFTACDMFLKADRNINYDGPSLVLQIGENGDPTRGFFDTFVFDDQGRDHVESSQLVTSG
ncbi:MAG: putative transporter substrate-binding protein, partial [Ilumatobacteraceae bacterium]|nr:putative transporter substrate-binding protein [Ilumatobacteraceae bacterium]